MGAKDLEEALEMGMDWSLRQEPFFCMSIASICPAGKDTAGQKTKNTVRSTAGRCL